MPLTHVIRVRFSYPLPTTLKINKLQNKSTKAGTKIEKAAYSAAFSIFNPIYFPVIENSKSINYYRFYFAVPFFMRMFAALNFIFDR